jgi:hypothetical protein
LDTDLSAKKADVTVLLWLLGMPTMADDRGYWEALADSRLVEVGDGQLSQALLQYEQLAEDLAADHPLRPMTLHHIGRIRYTLGQVDEARSALLECVRTTQDPDIRVACLELQGQIQLEVDSIRTVPTHWTFDDTNHGIFHPWRFDDIGSIRIDIDPQSNGPVLAWSTQVDVRKGDELRVGFMAPSPSPKTISLKVYARNMDAWLRAVIYDIHGRSYIANNKATSVPVGSWVEFEVDLTSLRALDNESVAFDPAELTALVLQDVTAYYGESGNNKLLIDDFMVQ